MTGRSFFSELDNFSKEKFEELNHLLESSKSPTTMLQGEYILYDFVSSTKDGDFKLSSTSALWNAEYLFHRFQDDSISYYFSVKQKSERHAGAEDFIKIRKSWHVGSGVFQLKVDGLEYNQSTLAGYDWHVLPGVTEEWRTDAMPLGSANAAGPGLNSFSGVTTLGNTGTSAFKYSPGPGITDNGNDLSDLIEYSVTSADKSYHLNGRFGVALGSNIKRLNDGQKKI